MNQEIIELAVDMTDDIFDASEDREQLIDNYNYYMAVVAGLAQYVGADFKPAYFADKTVH